MPFEIQMSSFQISRACSSEMRVLPINGPGPMALWPYGPMALWPYDPMAQWPNGPMAQRHYGTIVWCMFMTNA